MSAPAAIATILDCAALLSPSRGSGYQRLLNIAEMVDRGHYAPADALRIVGYGEHTQAGYDPDERAAFALAREALATVAVEVSRG